MALAPCTYCVPGFGLSASCTSRHPTFTPTPGGDTVISWGSPQLSTL